jgi:hypothetical protein
MSRVQVIYIHFSWTSLLYVPLNTIILIPEKTVRYFEQRTFHQNFPVYFSGVVQAEKSTKSDLLGNH